MAEPPEQQAIDALDTALAELRTLRNKYPSACFALHEVANTRDALVRLFNGPT